MRVSIRFFGALAALVVLAGGVGAFAVWEMAATQAESTVAHARSAALVSACEHLAGDANHASALLLGYLRGAVTLDDVTAAREEFAEDAREAEALAGNGTSVAEGVGRIRERERAIFQSSVGDAGLTLPELIEKARAAKEDVLGKNAKHRARLLGFMSAFGTPERNATLTRVLTDIESERIAILEFERTLDVGPSEAGARINLTFGLNSIIVRTLAQEAARELLDAAGALTSASGPGGEDRERVAVDLIALSGRVAVVTATSDEPATVGVFGQADDALARAERLGLPVPRADVATVGPNATAVGTLGKVVTCQQGLRASASTYFNATFAIQKGVREVLQDHAEALRHAASDTILLAKAEAAAAEARAEARSEAARITIAVLLVAAIGVVSAVGAAAFRYFASRLAVFDRAAAAVAQGRFDAPAPPERRDEFDPLSRAWAGMTRALLDRDREIARKNAILHQSERMATLGSLVAGVAHEVNNPLAFVKGNEELAIEDVDALIARPAIAADSKATALLGGVREMLASNVDGLTRIERTNKALKGFAGPAKEERELEDLNEVIKGVLIIAHNRLKNRFRIARDFTPNLPKALVSSHEIGQVVLNLIINAADAMPDGGEIRIATRAEDGIVRVTVHDDGSGVPASVQPRLFSPFATTKPEGSGLGLYISRAIARAHGGDLVLEDSPHGAAFTLVIPAAAAAPSDDGREPGGGTIRPGVNP